MSGRRERCAASLTDSFFISHTQRDFMRQKRGDLREDEMNSKVEAARDQETARYCPFAVLELDAAEPSTLNPGGWAPQS